MRVYCFALRRRTTYDYELIGWELIKEDGTLLAKGPFLNPLKRAIEKKYMGIEVIFMEGNYWKIV